MDLRDLTKSLDVTLTPDEHAALMDFVSKITNKPSPEAVIRYLVVDYLASELGYDLSIPDIGSDKYQGD